jgi:hypothetical protein
VQQVQAVLVEYQDYLPLTIRQVFYRLVGNSGYDKTEQAYSRLCETLNRARRSGVIDFQSIRDDGVSAYRPTAYSGVADFRRSIGYIAEGYRRDRQEGQAVRLWVMCEAGGMAPMLARVADEYGVPVLTSGGFDSVTAKHDLAQEIARADCAAEILHIGDHDPSGVHLFSALAEDVTAFARGLGAYDVQFTRLAVTPEQMADMGLLTAPPKKTDRRAFEGQTTQAEAIPPDVLSQLVRDAITARQCPDVCADMLDIEGAERAGLIEWAASKN